MIEQLISKLFVTRNVAHLAHWKTTSFSQHMALGDFYDSIVDLLDGIVESYQGSFGMIGDVALNASPKQIEILSHLKQELTWLENNREKIANGSTSIQNQVDSLMQAYQTTIYKLTFLK